MEPSLKHLPKIKGHFLQRALTESEVTAIDCVGAKPVPIKGWEGMYKLVSDMRNKVLK